MAAAGVLAGLAAAAPQASALTITPFFDPASIGGAPNAAAIEDTVDEAIGIYESLFTTPVNVTIGFSLVPGAGGQSLDTAYSLGYPQYTTALANNAAATGNRIQASAVASLPFGNQAQAILGTSADLRALGFAGAVALLPNVVAGGPALDGTIGLGAGLSFTRPIGPGATDGQAVAEHEIDEVLGIGGPGSIINLAVNRGTPPPPAPVINGVTTIGAEDLFRYHSFHTPSLTANPNAVAYFSFNAGATRPARFNQGPQGDFADWFGAPQGRGCVVSVQNWDGCTVGHQLDVTAGSLEATALTAIGYDPAALPLRPGPIVTNFASPDWRRFGSPQPAFVAVPFSNEEPPINPISDALELGILGRAAVTTFLNEEEEANDNFLEFRIHNAHWLFPTEFFLNDGDLPLQDLIELTNVGSEAFILFRSDPPGLTDLPPEFLASLTSGLGPLDSIPVLNPNTDGSFTLPSTEFEQVSAPEPATILIFVVGLSGLAALRFVRRSADRGY